MERKPNGYWNVYENCFKEAKKYNTLRDFFYKSGRCYQLCRKRGWIDNFTWLKRLDRKTDVWWKNGQSKAVAQFSMDGEYIGEYESATEALRAVSDKNAKCAPNIISCCKGKLNSCYGYKWVFKEDVDKAFTLFEERKQRLRCVKLKLEGYTEEEVLEEAKKYKTKKEFRAKSKNYYCAAQRLGILGKLPLKRVLNPYKDELYSVYAYLFNETHSAYVGVTDNEHRRDWEHRYSHKLDRDNSTVFKHARDNGLEIPKPIRLESGLEPYEALDKEERWEKLYREQGWNILNKARTGRYCGSLGSSRHLSKKKVIEEAKKYTTISEFRTAKGSYYGYARRKGFLDTLGLKRERHNPYSYEDCYNVALKYSTIKEFSEKEPKIYYKSHDEGWHRDYFWLANQKRGFSVAISKPITDKWEWNVIVFGSVKEVGVFFGLKRCSLRNLDVSARIRGYSASVLE